MKIKQLWVFVLLGSWFSDRGNMAVYEAGPITLVVEWSLPHAGGQGLIFGHVNQKTDICCRRCDLEVDRRRENRFTHFLANFCDANPPLKRHHGGTLCAFLRKIRGGTIRTGIQDHLFECYRHQDC